MLPLSLFLSRSVELPPFFTASPAIRQFDRIPTPLLSSFPYDSVCPRRSRYYPFLFDCQILLPLLRFPALRPPHLRGRDHPTHAAKNTFDFLTLPAPTTPTMPNPAIPRLAERLASKLHARSTRRRPITPAFVRRLVELLTTLDGWSTDFSNMSWHVHVSGHDDKGDVYWIPVYEDPFVLKSSAKAVLDSVYRFVEAAGAMSHGGTTHLKGVRGRSLPGNATSAGGPGRSLSTAGERRRGSGTTPAGQSGSLASSANTGRSLPPASTWRGLPPARVTSPLTDLDLKADTGSESDAETRATAAAAAVFENATEEDQDADGDAAVEELIRSSLLGDPSAATVAATRAAAATAAAAAPAGNRAATDTDPKANGATRPTTSTISFDVGLEDESEMGEEDGAALDSQRSAGPRNWRPKREKRPIVDRVPSAIAPTRLTLQLVEKVLKLSNVRSHLRALMPVLGHTIAADVGTGVTSVKFMLEWWPRTNVKQVWPLVRPLAFHATWNPTFYISPISNITLHVARFLRDSLYASNIRYNGLHLFSGSYGHADRPDPA